MTKMERDTAEFKAIFRETIKREGAEALLAWLESTDFFTAPAGAYHHGAFPGGLVAHSLNVYRELRRDFLSRMTAPDGESLWPDQETTIAVCALLHDVCKADFYALDYKNKKNAAGVWEKVPYYTVKDAFPFGHGEKSVYLITQHMKLTREEALAIRWHMGAYDNAVRGGDKAMDAAMNYTDLVLMLQNADMWAARQEIRQEKREAENGRKA